MSDEVKYCEHCGAKLNGRWESLGAGLCNTLVRFYEIVLENKKNDVHLQKDCNFTKNEYNNFQKLHYFGLVAKVDDSDKLKSGRWLLTHRGATFLKGEQAVDKKVYIFRNRIEGRSEEKVYLKDVIHEQPYWREAEDFVGGMPVQETLI